IHYVLNGGENSELNPAGYAKGDSAIVLADPQKENDEFEGWFLDEDFTQRVDTIKTEHYGDWTLYAKWKSYFVVDIEMNGGQFYNGTEFYKPHVVKWSADSAAYVLGKAYWSGFEFAGWYADSLLEQEITEIPAGNTEDLTVYAKWNTTEYTITYHMNGGENSLENLTAFNAADVGFEFKAPAREGAKFYRWTPEKLSYYSAVQLTEKKSIDLFAEWTPAPQVPEQDTAGCYHLKNKEELYWFAGLVNGTLDSTVRNPKACATLDSDIVINENMWQDSALNLDDSLTYFVWDAIWDYEGTFLGNGHSITGLLANSSCGDEHLFAGLFCNASSYKNVVNVKVNGSYVQEFGYIDNFVITGGTMPAQPGTLQGEWRAVVGGKSVSLFGLAPGKMLFVYDLQGRLLRRERTEPTMLMDFMDAGKFLIRYGNETRAVTIR
ncbi:InlB B-repeat-containing protein, partial [uncultured Fibrobacter sp.]|uniref:InlB B-repeat-containing protein n=1 Tax=uncultured Fibrobacter sp. TaxID=261512 RepID=UPI002607DCD2